MNVLPVLYWTALYWQCIASASDGPLFAFRCDSLITNFDNLTVFAKSFLLLSNKLLSQLKQIDCVGSDGKWPQRAVVCLFSWLSKHIKRWKTFLKTLIHRMIENTKRITTVTMIEWGWASTPLPERWRALPTRDSPHQSCAIPTNAIPMLCQSYANRDKRSPTNAKQYSPDSDSHQFSH